MIITVFMGFMILAGIALIIDGIREYSKFKTETPIKVEGSVIRNDESQVYRQARKNSSGRTIRRAGMETTYTAIYQYEYKGIREVRYNVSYNNPTNIGEKHDIYIYDDGTVTFKKVSVFNEKVGMGIGFVIGFSAAIYFYICFG